MKRSRYQNGCLRLEPRKNAPDSWVFYWREQGRLRKKVIGSKLRFRTETEALRHLDPLKLRINENHETPAVMSLGMVIQHYIANELLCEKPRLDYSTRSINELYLKKWILPRWEETQLEKLKGIEVEKWLEELVRPVDSRPLANGTKAKIRNIMSAVYSHAIRYGWISLNPIASVRQSAKRQFVPDILTIPELCQMLEAMSLREYTLVVLDFGTGLRVSEMLALKWKDIDFKHGEINVRRKIYHQRIGDCKTEASQKPVPMDGFLAETLIQWYTQTAYGASDDWVFASPTRGGRQPYWPENLRRHVQRVAAAQGIKKKVGWHTFRRTLSTLLVKNGNDIKTVQELLRHASARITLEIYAQALGETKREAQGQIYRMLQEGGVKSLALPRLQSQAALSD